MTATTRLTVYHGTSLVSPDPHPKILKDVAEYEFRSFEPNSEGQLQTSQNIGELYKRNHDGQIAIPTGLATKLATRLAQEGTKVLMDDLRTFPERQVISPSALNPDSRADAFRLSKVHNSPLGQIEVENRDETYDWIALLLRSFPDAKLLVVVPNKRMAWRIRQELELRVPEATIRIKKEGWPSTPPRCLIANTAYLESCPAKRFDIVLVPSLEVVSHTYWLRGMQRFLMDSYRLYSFSERGQLLSKYEQIVLEAVSGPMIHQLRQPAVQVLWVPTPHTKIGDHERRTLEWKRLAYYKNGRRNEFVAGLANAFARQNVKKLRKLGVPFHGDEPDLPNWGNHDIAILVESPEHANELLERLPGWRIQMHGLHPADGRASEPATGIITTTTYAASMGIQADVVIQAAGGQGLGQFKNTIAEIPAWDEESIPALIMELSDSNDELTRDDSEGRARMYAKLNWKEVT